MAPSILPLRVSALFARGVLLLIATAYAPPAVIAQAEPTDLKPDWVRHFEHGVEWCAVGGGGPGTALLVCSKNARLDLLDLRAGQSRVARPIPVQPGMRFAGGSGNVAYGYGRTQVYAFLVETGADRDAGQPGLLWQTAAAPEAETQGDPEFLTRVVAAKATPSGVLIVRSDGRVAELDRRDGRRRWHYKLPEIATGTLHARGEKAALLWKRGDAFEVAFVDVGAGRPRVKLTTVNDALPIWTGLIEESLVVVWPRRFAVIPADGKPRFHELHPRVGARAATVGIHAPAPPRENEQTDERPPASALLLSASGGGSLCAYELATGELRWPDEDALELTVGGEPARSLRVSGDLVFVTGGRWFGVHRADRGDQLSWQARPASAIGAGANAGFAYGLFVGSRQRLRLVRQAMSGPTGPRTNGNAAPAARDFDLGQVSRVRDTLWPAGTLVVVEDNRVRAYTLP